MADPKHGWSDGSARAPEPTNNPKKFRDLGCAWLIAVKGKPNEPIERFRKLPPSNSPYASEIAEIAGVGFLLSEMPDNARVVLHSDNREIIRIMMSGKVASRGMRNDTEFMTIFEFAMKGKARMRRFWIGYASAKNSPKMQIADRLAQKASGNSNYRPMTA